jgi:serine/threonine protein kinase
MDAVLSESRILQALDHPALPQILGILPSVPELSIVMTLMPGKPLSSFIHPTPPSAAASPLPLPDVLRIALCLAEVLEYVAPSSDIQFFRANRDVACAATFMLLASFIAISSPQMCFRFGVFRVAAVTPLTLHAPRCPAV